MLEGRLNGGAIIVAAPSTTSLLIFMVISYIKLGCRNLSFFFNFGPILTGFSREVQTEYVHMFTIARASYYQCPNPTIIVRQRDQGASTMI